jgi:hypothetical protein
MNRYLFKTVVVALSACFISCAAQSTTKSIYSGSYESTEKKDSKFGLNVRQTAKTATIDFQAGNASGQGSAPDGSGKGEIQQDGSLKFNFEDSFGNKGTGTLKPLGTEFQLNMDLTTVSEPRAVSHYGQRVLQKK